MPYYLRHYFQPDFNHLHVRPVPMADGNTDARYLGYVQSVVAGQVLAELVQLEPDPENTASLAETFLGNMAETTPDTSGTARPIPEAALSREAGYKNFILNIDAIDARFVYDEPVFPLGPNCARDPQKPNRIISLINGFCFYYKGLITVKKLLNVRQDVDFRTGSIIFGGHIRVHGDVKPGFTLAGGNIEVLGRVDGGRIRSGGTVAIHGPLKGTPSVLVEAKGAVRLASCEQARIVTSGNLIVDGNCMHSELFVGGSLIIKGRLQGGSVHANGMVFIKDQLGSAQGAPTRIYLGYNPIDYLYLRDMKALYDEQTQKLQYHTNQARKGPHFAAESAPYLELAGQKLSVIKKRQLAAWRRFSQDVRRAARTRVIVPGIVYPGVEISIGRAFYKVIDMHRDVFFALHEDEVVNGFPAFAKTFTFAGDSGPSEKDVPS